MANDTAKRACVLTFSLLLLAAAPAAHAARKGRTPSVRPRANAGALGWLSGAWQWLASLWDEEGSEINPNGTPAPKPPTTNG